MLTSKFLYLQALAQRAPYNETHWHVPSWNALLSKAIGELDQTKAQSYWDQVQQIQYQQGGYLVWTNADYVDAASTKVKGLKPAGTGILGNHTLPRRVAGSVGRIPLGCSASYFSSCDA